MAERGEDSGMVFEYEQAAMRGEPIPPGLSAADRAAYLQLRGLYVQYHSRLISRETGSADKKRILRARDEEARAAAFRERCLSHTVRLWKEVECAASDYRKNRTLENADRIMEAIYGVGFPRRLEHDEG